MSDNTIDLVSDYEVETSYASIMGTSPNSHVLPLNKDNLELETISIFDDSDSERVSKYSLEENFLSSGSIDAFISNVGGGINHVEVLMPPHVLYKEEKVQANRYMREHAKIYIQLCLRIDNYESSDSKVNAYSDLWAQSDVVKYDWMNPNITGTSLALSNEQALNVADIMVGDPLE